MKDYFPIQEQDYGYNNVASQLPSWLAHAIAM